MSWVNSLSPGSHGGAKTGKWPAKGSGNAGRVELMDRPKREDQIAQTWLVNRCPKCESDEVVVRKTRRDRPARGYTTREVECRSCGHKFPAQQPPRPGC